jgi:hypothetical protein
MEDLIKDIEKCVKKHNLRSKSRYRQIVHRRMFIYNLLHEHKVPVSHIANYFGMHHATVIHGLKQIKIYKNDKLYLEDTEIYRRYFEIRLKKYNIDISQSKYILGALCSMQYYHILKDINQTVFDIEKRIKKLRERINNL